MINLLISLINLLIKPEPQKIEIDFGSKPIATTTAMSQSLDVIIAERIQSRLLERDALIDFFETRWYVITDDDGNDDDVDFFTYYTTHYGSEHDDNADKFIDDYRNDLWDELIYDDKKNVFYSDEEINEISAVNTIKLFKAAVALINDDDQDGLNDCVEAYIEENWLLLTTWYIRAMVNKLIDDNYLVISQIVYTYINDLQEAIQIKKINETSKHIAIQKIKRNQVFNCGLGLKLSMRNCGIELST